MPHVSLASLACGFLCSLVLSNQVQYSFHTSLEFASVRSTRLSLAWLLAASNVAFNRCSKLGGISAQAISVGTEIFIKRRYFWECWTSVTGYRWCVSDRLHSAYFTDALRSGGQNCIKFLYFQLLVVWCVTPYPHSYPRFSILTASPDPSSMRITSALTQVHYLQFRHLLYGPYQAPACDDDALGGANQRVRSAGTSFFR